MQELLGSVLGGFEVEELLVLVDELGVHGGVEELVVGQNVLEERDVGLERERWMERRRLLICCREATETRKQQRRQEELSVQQIFVKLHSKLNTA